MLYKCIGFRFQKYPIIQHSRLSTEKISNKISEEIPSITMTSNYWPLTPWNLLTLAVKNDHWSRQQLEIISFWVKLQTSLYCTVEISLVMKAQKQLWGFYWFYHQNESLEYYTISVQIYFSLNILIIQKQDLTVT